MCPAGRPLLLRHVRCWPAGALSTSRSCHNLAQLTAAAANRVRASPCPGPNGCGKSTLVRALRGLHPAEAGHLQLPPAASTSAQSCGCAGGGMMVVPQRPLAAPPGGLWQQVCYPGDSEAAGSANDHPDGDCLPSAAGQGQQGGSSSSDNSSRRPSNAELSALLRRVGLEHLADRVGGSFTAAADWAAMLSPGELQRLSVARVLHR